MRLLLCGTARPKAMGEALFGIVLAERAQSGIRGAPSSDPLIFGLNTLEGLASDSLFCRQCDHGWRWDRRSIAIRNAVPGNCRYAVARNKNPNKIQRVGSRQSDSPLRRAEFAHGSHRLHCNRQSELLADKSIHKTPAADFASVLKSTESHQQLAPRRQVRFPSQHI